MYLLNEPGWRRPVGNPPRDEPMPVDAPLGISHAESRKRRRPATGGDAPDVHPALNDVTALVGPIRKEAQVVGQTLNTLLCSKPIDSPTFLRSESKDTTGKLACSF